MLLKFGHAAGAFVMALQIAGLLIMLPLLLWLGFDSTLAWTGGIMLSIIFAVPAVREFYRNYDEWFESL